MAVIDKRRARVAPARRVGKQLLTAAHGQVQQTVAVHVEQRRGRAAARLQAEEEAVAQHGLRRPRPFVAQTVGQQTAFVGAQHQFGEAVAVVVAESGTERAGVQAAALQAQKIVGYKAESRPGGRAHVLVQGQAAGGIGVARIAHHYIQQAVAVVVEQRRATQRATVHHARLQKAGGLPQGGKGRGGHSGCGGRGGKRIHPQAPAALRRKHIGIVGRHADMRRGRLPAHGRRHARRQHRHHGHRPQAHRIGGREKAVVGRNPRPPGRAAVVEIHQAVVAHVAQQQVIDAPGRRLPRQHANRGAAVLGDAPLAMGGGLPRRLGRFRPATVQIDAVRLLVFGKTAPTPILYAQVERIERAVGLQRIITVIMQIVARRGHPKVEYVQRPVAVYIHQGRIIDVYAIQVAALSEHPRLQTRRKQFETQAVGRAAQCVGFPGRGVAINADARHAVKRKQVGPPVAVVVTGLHPLFKGRQTSGTGRRINVGACSRRRIRARGGIIQKAQRYLAVAVKNQQIVFAVAVKVQYRDMRCIETARPGVGQPRHRGRLCGGAARRQTERERKHRRVGGRHRPPPDSQAAQRQHRQEEGRLDKSVFGAHFYPDDNKKSGHF